MDEIFGYFPTQANLPSKQPMLVLLKQARAFGIGVVLATQNPIDLDYKGLSNIGNLFIGKFHTKQNKERFLYKSAKSDDLELFTMRWVMPYLKGSLKKILKTYS